MDIATQKTGGIDLEPKSLVEKYYYGIKETHGKISCAVEIVRRYVSTLDKTTQIICYHYLKGYSIEDTKVVTRTNETQINRILSKILENFEAFSQEAGKEVICDEKTEKDCKYMIDQEIDDDTLSAILKEDLPTTKISRFFAINLDKFDKNLA